MKYEMESIELPGLPWHLKEIELPDVAIIFYVRIGMKDAAEGIKLDINLEEIFSDHRSFKYNSDTGDMITIGEDGNSLREINIFTRIHYLMKRTL